MSSHLRLSRISPTAPDFTVSRNPDRPGKLTPGTSPGKWSLVTHALQSRCDCESGHVWQGRRGPNDPDGQYVKCDVPGCEDGVIHPRCDEHGCVGYATAVVEGRYLCEHCAAHYRAEADLAAIEALTDWCRGREHQIPFTLLYTAVAALGRLRGRP